MKLNYSIVSVLIAFLLASCGGGGSSSGMKEQNFDSTTQPILTANISKSLANINEKINITWTSINVDKCKIPEISKDEYGPNGSLLLNIFTGGLYVYNLECYSSNGLSVAKKLNLTVPMPVYKTSYENKNKINFYDTALSSIRSLNIPYVFDGEVDSRGAVAFGDFFQNGQYSAFTTAFRATNKYAASGTADAPSVAYFLKKNSDGKWIDGTAELLPNKDDRLNCVSNGYSIVADFNNDGKPDVYLACNGIDADLLPEIKNKLTLDDQNNLGLSKQFVYLSTALGQYRRVILPDMIYGHMAAAADLNHDGNIDILTTNQANIDIQPFVYLGNGDGTFKIDNSIVPPMMHQYTNKTPNDFHNAGLYQVELIPIDGRIDAIWASTAKTIWMKGRVNGEIGFNTSDVINFQAAKSPNYQLNYDMPKDFIYDYNKNVFYFGSRVAVDVYESKVEYAILKFSANGLFLGAKGIWLNHNNHDPSAPIDFRFQSFTDQYKQLPNGALKAYTSGCLIGVNGLPPQLPGRCAQTINVD